MKNEKNAFEIKNSQGLHDIAVGWIENHLQLNFVKFLDDLIEMKDILVVAQVRVFILSMITLAMNVLIAVLYRW